MRTRQAERGQTIVEFALVATFLISMVFGIIDFGEAFYTYNLVTDAARVGARWASVRGDTCTLSGCPATSASVLAYILSKEPALSASRLTYVRLTPIAATSCQDGSFDGPGCIAQVTVKYTYNFFYRFPPVVLTSSSQMTFSQ